MDTVEIKITKMESHLENQDVTLKRLECKVDGFILAMDKKAEKDDLKTIQAEIQRVADVKANKDDYVFLRNLVILTMIASIFVSIVISTISK